MPPFTLLKYPVLGLSLAFILLGIVAGCTKTGDLYDYNQKQLNKHAKG